MLILNNFYKIGQSNYLRISTWDGKVGMLLMFGHSLISTRDRFGHSNNGLISCKL